MTAHHDDHSNWVNELRAMYNECVSSSFQESAWPAGLGTEYEASIGSNAVAHPAFGQRVVDWGEQATSTSKNLSIAAMAYPVVWRHVFPRRGRGRGSGMARDRLPSVQWGRSATQIISHVRCRLGSSVPALAGASDRVCTSCVVGI